ncbi:MAG: hypothetical protein AB8B48_14860 [Pseudomonadales bacterium]
MRSRLRPFTAIMVLAGIAANAQADQQLKVKEKLTHKTATSIQPTELERHTSKLAEFRMNAISDDIDKQLRESNKQAKPSTVKSKTTS